MNVNEGLSAAAAIISVDRVSVSSALNKVFVYTKSKRRIGAEQKSAKISSISVCVITVN